MTADRDGMDNNRPFRRLGAVIDVHGTMVRLWINGVTSAYAEGSEDDSVWLERPAGMPDDLFRTGATFDVVFPPGTEHPREGTYTAQEFSDEPDDVLSDQVAVSMTALRQIAAVGDSRVHALLDSIDPTIRDPFAAGTRL